MGVSPSSLRLIRVIPFGPQHDMHLLTHVPALARFQHSELGGDFELLHRHCLVSGHVAVHRARQLRLFTPQTLAKGKGHFETSVPGLVE